MSILIIVGSTRPVRIGDQIARETAEVVGGEQRAASRIVDLRDLALPFLDEPKPAATGVYAHEHTLTWAALVREAEAVLFVVPQYNGSYPAPVKNAIDYLKKEWEQKPVGILSYGFHGGNKSHDHLADVLRHIKTQLVEPGVQIVTTHDDYDAEQHLAAPEELVGRYRNEIVRLWDGLAEAAHERD